MCHPTFILQTTSPKTMLSLPSVRPAAMHRLNGLWTQARPDTRATAAHTCARGRSSTVPRITAANKALVPVQGEGEILFEHQGKDQQKVQHVPKLTSNLASVSMIAKGGNKVVFLGNKCEVFNVQDKLILTDHLNSQNIWGVSYQLPQRAVRDPQIVLFLTHVYDTKMYLKKFFDKRFRRIFSSTFQWCRQFFRDFPFSPSKSLSHSISRRKHLGHSLKNILSYVKNAQLPI